MTRFGHFQDADLRLLRVFIAIVDNGGFTAAQTALNLSQPSLSEYVKALETRLGVVLCQRGPKGFKLYPAGQEVYTASREVFASLETFRARIADVNDGMVGDVTIAIQDGIITNPASRIHEGLEQFAHSYPNTYIRVETMLGFQMLGRVADGVVDLGIGLRDDGVQLDFVPLFDERSQVYCGRRHPLFTVTQDRLTGDLVRQFAYCSRGHLETIDIDWSGRHAGDVGLGTEAQMALILSGRNVGYLLPHIAQPFVERGLLRPLPILSSPGASCVSIAKRAANTSLITRRMIEAITAAHRT